MSFGQKNVGLRRKDLAVEAPDGEGEGGGVGDPDAVGEHQKSGRAVVTPEGMGRGDHKNQEDDDFDGAEEWIPQREEEPRPERV
jgi:hypothetical protein